MSVERGHVAQQSFFTKWYILSVSSKHGHFMFVMRTKHSINDVIFCVGIV